MPIYIYIERERCIYRERENMYIIDQCAHVHS